MIKPPLISREDTCMCAHKKLHVSKSNYIIYKLIKLLNNYLSTSFFSPQNHAIASLTKGNERENSTLLPVLSRFWTSWSLFFWKWNFKIMPSPIWQKGMKEKILHYYLAVSELHDVFSSESKTLSKKTQFIDNNRELTFLIIY